MASWIRQECWRIYAVHLLDVGVTDDKGFSMTNPYEVRTLVPPIITAQYRVSVMLAAAALLVISVLIAMPGLYLLNQEFQLIPTSSIDSCH